MPYSRIATALLCGAALPPAVAMLVWVYAFRLDPVYLVEAVSFRLFTLLFMLLMINELVRAVLNRSLFAMLLCLGLLLVLLQAVVWYGFRFSGMAAVGADEQITEYYSSQLGAFNSPPRIPIKVVSVSADPMSVVLARDGIETRLEKGKSVQRDGFAFRLSAVEHAPLVAVRTARGESVDEAYLKITSTGEHGDFIMFGRLPHRFYVKEVLDPASGTVMFRLKVVRDKLTIVDSMVRKGEGVYFDGHYVTCRPGAPWARLEVTKQQSRLLLWGGLLLAVAGLPTGFARIKYRRDAGEGKK